MLIYAKSVRKIQVGCSLYLLAPISRQRLQKQEPWIKASTNWRTPRMPSGNITNNLPGMMTQANTREQLHPKRTDQHIADMKQGLNVSPLVSIGANHSGADQMYINSSGHNLHAGKLESTRAGPFYVQVQINDTSTRCQQAMQVV